MNEIARVEHGTGRPFIDEWFRVTDSNYNPSWIPIRIKKYRPEHGRRSTVIRIDTGKKTSILTENIRRRYLDDGSTLSGLSLRGKNTA